MTLPVQFPAAALSPYVVLPALLAVLISSSAVFWILNRRWTRQRKWVALGDWADAHDWTLSRGRGLRGRGLGGPAALDPPPAALHGLPGESHATVVLSSPRGLLLQLEVTGTPIHHSSRQPSRWNLLIYSLPAPWPTAALRPARHATSFIDFFPLDSYPSLAPPQRFVVYATQLAVARLVAGSALRGLLPPDVGLMLTGRSLILDFSHRPFDEIELQRMTSLAEQIVSRLPLPPQ